VLSLYTYNAAIKMLIDSGSDPPVNTTMWQVSVLAFSPLNHQVELLDIKADFGDNFDAYMIPHSTVASPRPSWS